MYANTVQNNGDINYKQSKEYVAIILQYNHFVLFFKQKNGFVPTCN